MRILWVSYSALLDGAELSMAESVSALTERGHSVHVVLPEAGPLTTHLGAASSVRLCWHNRWVTKPGLSIREKLRWSAYNTTVAARRIARIARTVDAQLIVTNAVVSPAGAIAAGWSRRPHVWYLHEYAIEQQGLTFHLGHRASMAVMRALTDTFLVNSETCRTAYARWLPGRKLHRIDYAVDVPSLPDLGRSSRDEPLRLVLVGRRVPAKGPADAILAVGRLLAAGVNVELELIGGADKIYDEKLRRLVAENGADGRIRFIDAHDGHLSRVAAADVALMCSRCDAFGRVTIEAMKLGKPVIGAAAGATPELIKHEWNGMLYEPGDSAGLARRIMDLAGDRELPQKLGERGRRWAFEKFNREVHTAELEEILEPLAHRRAPA